MKPHIHLVQRIPAASTAIILALLIAPAAAALQQNAPSERKPAFEAATIKLAAPDTVRNRVMPTSPNRLSIPSMSLVWLVYTAYGDGGFNTAMRVTGGPDWVNRTAFAVEGVASENVTPQQLRLMLQTLLEERPRTCGCARIRAAIAVHRRPGAMGTTRGAEPGAVQGRRDRERGTANRELAKRSVRLQPDQQT